MRELERRVVRRYRRSEAPRMRWTEELHRCFVQAVVCLGGHQMATPKRILQQMGVRGLNIAHVKSHLQMYRSTGNNDDVQIFQPPKDFDKQKTLQHSETSFCGSQNSFDAHMAARSNCSGSFQIQSIEEVLRDWALEKGCLRLGNGCITPSESKYQSKKKAVNSGEYCELSLSSLSAYQFQKSSEETSGWESSVEFDMNEKTPTPRSTQLFDSSDCRDEDEKSHLNLELSI